MNHFTGDLLKCHRTQMHTDIYIDLQTIIFLCVIENCPQILIRVILKCYHLLQPTVAKQMHIEKKKLAKKEEQKKMCNIFARAVVVLLSFYRQTKKFNPNSNA